MEEGSDETIVEANDGCPRLVRVVDGHPLTSEHNKSVVKHPTKVMFWSCFSWKGTGRVHVVEDTLNSEKYVDLIINRCVIAQLTELFSDGDGIFQQDNAPCHVSKRTTEHIRSLNITLLSWPP